MVARIPEPSQRRQARVLVVSAEVIEGLAYVSCQQSPLESIDALGCSNDDLIREQIRVEADLVLSPLPFPHALILRPHLWYG